MTLQHTTGVHVVTDRRQFARLIRFARRRNRLDQYERDNWGGRALVIRRMQSVIVFG